MFENITNFFKSIGKKETKNKNKDNSKDAAKERLHLVLMQDRANVSVDFLELMKQEIIDVIKKYIEIDEKEIDVRLTNKENEDGTNGAPALYANIPILNIKNDARKISNNNVKEEIKEEQDKKETSKEEQNNKEIDKKKEESNKKEKSKKEENNKKDNVENKEEIKENNNKEEKEEKINKTENKEKSDSKKEEDKKEEVQAK